MKISEVKPIMCQGGIRTWTFVKVSTDTGIIGWGVEIVEEEVAKHPHFEVWYSRLGGREGLTVR